MANTIKFYITSTFSVTDTESQDNETQPVSLYKRFPRASRKYIKENNLIKDLVPFGSNLSSTVGYPTYGLIVQHMVAIPGHIENIIVGILLSDGWMQKQNKGGHARLFFKQSIVRSEYVFFVFILLQHYCKSYPQLGYSKLKGKTFLAPRAFLNISTRSLVCFTEIYSLFYVEGKKIVPHNIFDLLTIEGLAHWVCGDGSYANGGGLYLNTQSFTVLENVRLINVLIIKFNCKCSIHMQRGLPVIYISSRTMKNLEQLLKPFIPASMFYKITRRKN